MQVAAAELLPLVSAPPCLAIAGAPSAGDKERRDGRVTPANTRGRAGDSLPWRAGATLQPTGRHCAS